MVAFRSLLAVASLGFATILLAAEYPNQKLLLEPAELAQPEVAKTFVILDARPKAQFEAGHIPGSLWVDHAAWAKAFGDGDDAKGWSARIGQLGLTAKSKVVVVDDNQTKDSARIWWILRYWGVEDVRLLNGGWKGWTAAKLEVTKETTAVAGAKFDAVSQADRLAT